MKQEIKKEKTFKTLTNDLCFKYVFCHKDLLKDFIDSFLEYLNLDIKFSFTDIGIHKYIMPHNKTYIGYLGDIIAILDNESIISLECYSSRFKKRDYNKSYGYMCRLFDNNIEDSISYNAKKIISLNLMNGNYKRINNDLVNAHHFTCRNKVSDNENMTMYLVRLDKLKNIQYTEYSRFIKWLRLINAKSLEEMENIGRNDKNMEEAIAFVKKWNNKTPEEVLDNYVNDKVKMARAEEREEKTIEIAKNMFALNIDINDIAKATGLSKQELNELKKDL